MEQLLRDVNPLALIIPAICGGIYFLIYIAALWRIFSKAGQRGWAALIPIYNAIVLLRVARKPWWWLLLFFVPLVNIVLIAIMWIDIGFAFHRSTEFSVALWLLNPLFILILAFGGSSYRYLGIQQPDYSYPAGV